MKNLMSSFRRVSIRTQILILTSIVAVPAMGIIIYSGVTMRNAAVNDARLQTQRLAENIAAEQQNLMTSAQQLIIALTQLPDVQSRNKERMSQVLINIQRLNPQYSNILIADPDGQVWAHAIPGGHSINVSDRRYFQNAMASGRLSAGEYIHSRIPLSTSRMRFATGAAPSTASSSWASCSNITSRRWSVPDCRPKAAS
jgi:hypothetical protein